MESEVKEKLEQTRTKVSMTISDIPMTVHKKVERYRRQIIGERQRDFTMKEAYREFLIHCSKIA